MQLHRFYLAPENCRDATLWLEGREAHHALHVLRLKRGDSVLVLDGAGNEFSCEVEDAARDRLSLRVQKRNFIPPPPCSLALFVGIPRGKIIENIIQKSVELGARTIAPLLTERVVTRLDEEAVEHKREQWQQVAIEAMKQCGAAYLPEIATPRAIEDFLARKGKPDLQLVGSLQKERRHPRAIFQEYEKANRRPPRSAAVWVGPEGDFTLDELKAIQNSGAQPISLGSLVLRVETAAIYCLSILNYEFNSPDE
ncbi:MAG TPA: RsmE family RNA methyltransferase [Candidatus Acidoferrales bacterium]|jgi:16S rRNA (uracil1498-N3)-methyltransferase|nr:RsmE family RNA methyltransferase [Candidatus Acidoferrales bacterium]